MAATRQTQNVSWWQTSLTCAKLDRCETANNQQARVSARTQT